MATIVEERVVTELAPPPVIPGPPRPARTRARRPWIKWTLLAAALIVVTGGLEMWRSYSRAAVHYDTVAVERGPIQASVTATGTVNAVVDVQVGSQVSGNIKALYADFNTKVKKGQLVAEIDPTVFQTQVDQAKAAVGVAHAAVLTAEAQVAKAQSDSAGAVATEKSTEAVLAKDRANALNAAGQFNRQDGLFKQQIISLQDYDTAKAAMDAANAQVAADQAQIDASKQALQSAQKQVQVTRSQLASAQAQERESQASLDQAEVNLGHTRITAPVDGTVIARHMDVGQTVAASFQSPTIFEIDQDLTKMQLDTNVDESDVGGIRDGQNATFTVDAYPGLTFHGAVTSIRKAPIIAQNVVTYDVVISVANPDLKLFPGMTANVRILTERVENALKVPNPVLLVHPSAEVAKSLNLAPPPRGRDAVYAVVNGKVQTVPVKFGLSDGKFTALTAGDLHAGEALVSRFLNASATPGGTAERHRGPGF